MFLALDKLLGNLKIAIAGQFWYKAEVQYNTHVTTKEHIFA
jgi:hypothetical protein